MSTQRLDENKSTQRIDANQSTQRLDNDQGTQRLDSESTQRLDNTSSYSDKGASQTQSHTSEQETAANDKKTGEMFTLGQVIELNGQKYVIEKLVSMSSGEAVIYLISSKGKNCILKYYKTGLRYPEKVLKTIKDNPQDKIIRLFEYGNRNGQDFEIMEYAEGGTLDDYLKVNGPVRDIAKLRTIVDQINEGLNQLHNELRIIYQDLKPENIYFKDIEKTKIVLADFGISNIMLDGKNEAEVNANVTKEYAAPELSRTGNEKIAIVGPPIDYFALGVTIYHLWLGQKPFQDISQSARDNMVRENAVVFPEEMSNEFKTLIQGLINQTRGLRWGYSQLSKWVKGESITSDYKQININYTSVMFNESESYSSPAELAELLEKFHDRGITHLFEHDRVLPWLEKSGNTYLHDEIKSAIKTYADNKDAGLYKIIYMLDPDRPFISNGGTSCNSTTDIADAIMNESAFYMKDLVNKNARLYLYFEAVEGSNGKNIVDEFLKHFSEYSPQRAIKMCYLKMQEDTGQSIKIGSKIFNSPEEASEETDSGTRTLIKNALMEKDSLFNVWLSDYYDEYYESTEGLLNINPSDKFFILDKFQFLSYKELHKNWQKTALNELIGLIHNNPGRHDLFEAYARQELPFNGNSDNLDWHPTPINYLVKFFDDIISDFDVGANLLRFLHEHGSDVNEPSGDGSVPLVDAILNRNVSLVKMLLEIGANPNEPNDCAPILHTLFWIGDSEDSDDPNIRINIAELLLDYKANVNVTNRDYTPLRQSLFLKTPNIVDFISRLIKEGANVNEVDENGITILVQAMANYCKRGNNKEKDYLYKIVEILLKNGAKTETLDKKGYWSPLMGAADFENTEMVLLLIKYKADKYFADADGNTAQAYALSKRNYQISNILKPDSTFKLKAALYKLARIIFAAFSALWIFLAMDVLTRGIFLLDLSFPFQIASSILLSHILTAYIWAAGSGIKKYFNSMKTIYSSAEKAMLHIILIPVIFPLVIAGTQFLTKFLPDKYRMILYVFLDMAGSSSPAMLFVFFFLPLVVFLICVIFFDKITSNFARILR